MTTPNGRGSKDDRATDRPTDRRTPDLYVSRGQNGGGADCCHDSSAPSSFLPPASPPSRTTPHRPRGRGLGKKNLRELGDQLAPRDLAILELIALHRFLTTKQIEAFYFDDHHTNASSSRRARSVMARLERLDLVERPARRVGGLFAGSAPSVWMLTSIAVRLRSILSGSGDVGRVRTPGERYIAHHIAVADIHLALVQAQRIGKLVLHSLQAEPESWRSYDGAGGERRTLKPDLAAVVSLPGDEEFEEHYAVEVDLATESIPAVLKQCRQYLDYQASGAAQQHSGVFPWVVWVAPAKRAERIRAAIDAARGINRELFKVTTPEGIVSLMANGSGG